MPPPILTTPTTHDRLTDSVTQHIAAALRTAALSERVTWDVALQLANGPDGPAPVLAIYLQTPSQILGQCCGELVLIEPGQGSEANITQLIVDACGRLFAARARSAALTPVG